MSLRRSLAWLLPFGLLVYAMVSVPVRILSEEGLPRYRRLQEQLSHVHHENISLAADIERLNREVDALRNDRDAIERIARDELGMVQQGEIVFQFPKQ